MQVIAGALPANLAGTYYRNGPNPRFTPVGSYTYPLDGDGMVHAVGIGGGRATALARGDSDEDDGYVLTYRYAGDATDLVVLHAQDIAGEPAAVLRMPQRVPFGLHGTWVKDASGT